MPDGTTLTIAPTDAPATGDATAPARPLAERQIEALGELVDIGLKIARAIERRVDAASQPPPSVADLNAAAIASGRVARAVRQTVMLQSKLKAEQAIASAKAGDLRARVSRIVRRAIEDEHDGAEQVERLAAEAAERLEQERYGDVLARSARSSPKSARIWGSPLIGGAWPAKSPPPRRSPGAEPAAPRTNRTTTSRGRSRSSG